MNTALRRGGLSAAVGLALGLAVLPGQARAATVVPCNDIPALKAAIDEANRTGESITLASGCTYTLTSADNGDNGLPVITGNVRIASNGATIRRSPTATDDFRIFQVDPGASLSLTRTSITGGLLQGTGDGGGIRSGGRLSLTGGAVSGSRAMNGGGIANQLGGRLTLNQTTVENNEAESLGGGVENGGGTMSMTSGALRNNRAGSDGGGVENFGRVDISITGATITGNTSGGFGGGIDSFLATLRVTDGTISKNEARRGGGLYSTTGTARLVGARVTANTATGGPGSGGGIFESSGEVRLTGGSVTNNTPENCAPPGSIPGCTG
jgi:hypothetical protein